jgi:hypothetical protein
MDYKDFIDILRRMNLTASALAHILQELGDTSGLQTIERRVRRWTNGETSVPGEAVALLTLLMRVRSASELLIGALGESQTKGSKSGTKSHRTPRTTIKVTPFSVKMS